MTYIMYMSIEPKENIDIFKEWRRMKENESLTKFEIT
jgi:hypothetical protein